MKRILINENEIKEIVSSLGKQITTFVKSCKKPPVFIGVLKGATPFIMDLIREIDEYIEIDFVQYSSYFKTENTGVLVMKKDVTSDIKGRDVIVVEDIVDTGKTLRKLIQYLEGFEPNSIHTCVFLDKKCKRTEEVNIDWVGKVIGNEFVIGYGLDYLEVFRNTKEIYSIDADDEELKKIENLMK